MACDTCDHTMQKLNHGKAAVHWCPRCGTIKSGGMIPEFATPELVGRARALCVEVAAILGNSEVWGLRTIDLLQRAAVDVSESLRQDI